MISKWIIAVTAAGLIVSGAALGFAGGDGTAGAPYQISEKKHLERVNDDLDAFYALIADIDLKDSAYTESVIAREATAFTGVLDGNGFAIRQLRITAVSDDFVGLFGKVGADGRVQNLNLEEAAIAGGSNVAALVGENAGTIVSCRVQGTVSARGNRSGGLAGRNVGVISGCNADVAVRGRGEDVGGLVGFSRYDTALITHSSAHGSVVSTGERVGGLVGETSGPVTNCYAVGKTSGRGDFVGGLIGRTMGEITGSFWDMQTSGYIWGVGGGRSFGAYGRKTSEMKTVETFLTENWRFAGRSECELGVWDLPDSDSYPVLANQAGTKDVLRFEFPIFYEGQVDIFEPGAVLFEDREHTASDDIPTPLNGMHFVRSNWNGTGFKSLDSGLMYALVRADRAVIQSELAEMGFDPSPVPDFQLFGTTGVGNVAVYQKNVNKGDELYFSRAYGVFLSPRAIVLASPQISSETERLYNGILLPSDPRARTNLLAYGYTFIAATRQEQDWDRGYVQSVGGICTIMGDELWFYYIGFQGDTGKIYTTFPDWLYLGGMHANASTGIAKLRRDGFASMDAGRRTGTLTTRPITFSKGDRVFVNVNTPDGRLRVEVLDADGRVIEGLSVADSVPVSVDSTIEEVLWNTNKNLADLQNRPIRLRFHLTNGQLYAFWVSDASGASHGYVAAGGPGYTSGVDTVGRAARDAAKKGWQKING